MSEPATICFVGTTELKTMVEEWAREDERSVSYIMRQILKREAQRRKPSKAPQTKPLNQ